MGTNVLRVSVLLFSTCFCSTMSGGIEPEEGVPDINRICGF
jgi:hypothetical protein